MFLLMNTKTIRSKLMTRQTTHRMPMELRSAGSRGKRRDHWLSSYFSFSFGDYYHPNRMQFSKLRAINDDWIAPATGFDTHPHRDMEIITYVLSGELQHADNLGNEGIIRAGQVQTMTAGSGMVHSEHNPSDTEPVHLLQIWLLPRLKNLAPHYAQAEFPQALKRQRWCLIASPDVQDESLTVQQDVRLWATLMHAGEHMHFVSQPGRACYLHVLGGKVTINDHTMADGDALAIDELTDDLVLFAHQQAEILLFDLPIVDPVGFSISL